MPKPVIWDFRQGWAPPRPGRERDPPGRGVGPSRAVLARSSSAVSGRTPPAQSPPGVSSIPAHIGGQEHPRGEACVSAKLDPAKAATFVAVNLRRHCQWVSDQAAEERKVAEVPLGIAPIGARCPSLEDERALKVGGHDIDPTIAQDDRHKPGAIDRPKAADDRHSRIPTQPCRHPGWQIVRHEQIH